MRPSQQWIIKRHHHEADKGRDRNAGENPGGARETPKCEDEVSQHEDADGSGIGQGRIDVRDGVKQKASHPDGDEVQDEENLPKRALVGRAFCDHHGADERSEDETAVRDRIQWFSPEGRAETALAIIENGGCLE